MQTFETPIASLRAGGPVDPPAGPQPLTLDCHMDFAEQSAKIIAQPNLTAAQHAPGEPYTFYSTTDGHVSYLITEPGAPGHPAIDGWRA